MTKQGKINGIGLRIRFLRQREQKSQQQIAERLGVSIPAFSKMETGVTDINVSRILQISELFNVKPAYFFEEEGEYSKETAGKIELIRQLQEKTSIIVDLQNKLIQCYEQRNNL